MLIVTIEGLVWICTINGILNQLGKTHTHKEAESCVSFRRFDRSEKSPRPKKNTRSTRTCPPPSHQLPPSCSQVKVLDGEDEYYKLLSAVESIPEEEQPTSASASSRPL